MIQSKNETARELSLFVFGKNEPQSEPLNRIAENLTKNRRFSLSAVRRYAIMNTEDKIYKGDDVMFFYTKEEVIKLTPQWTGERLEDGRPKVPASVLERMRKLTLEEVWGTAWMQGYEFQAEGHFLHTHPTEDHRMVGRAVTCVCVPLRQDLHEVATAESREFGFMGGYNKSAVDRLVEDDVMVVDLFDKVHYGTFFGGNLSTQLKNKTKRGGAVVWGGIRDLDQVKKIDGIQIYYRGSHPTPIRDYVMTGYNAPCRIGEAICMPGDIVFGSNEGVVFIPAHLAEKTVDSAEKSHLKDDFGFERLKQGVYNATEIDHVWTEEMWNDFMGWFKSDENAQKFSYLDWTEDLELARKMREDPETMQCMAARFGARGGNSPARSTI